MRAFKLVVLALCTGGGACASLGANSAEDATRVITRLEDEWIQVDIRRDSAEFSRLLAPDFSYTENDQVWSRVQFLKDMMTGTDTVTSGRNDNLVVRVSGNTAIATGWLTLRGRGAKGPFEQHYRFTDTWQYLDGRWQVLAAQDYLKP